jgi:hypothetical protein
LFIATVLAGCGTLGNRLNQRDLPPGAPEVTAVLEDLAENDTLLNTLDARGRFIVESPDLREGKLSCAAHIWYRRPTDLNVIGTHQLTGLQVFKLTCLGSEFLLQLPTEKKCYYFLNDMPVEDTQFSVSPSDVAKEMFLAESWAEIKPNQLTIEAYDDSTGVLTIAVGSRRSPRRRIELSGPPWRVIKNTRLEKDAIVSETTMSEYYEKDGVRFPTEVDCWFPSRQSRMTFKVRDPKINPEFNNDPFVIDREAAKACSKSLN